jgi:hypothetical protein
MRGPLQNPTKDLPGNREVSVTKEDAFDYQGEISESVHGCIAYAGYLNAIMYRFQNRFPGYRCSRY